MRSKLAADMFVLGLPIAEKIIRPIVVYIFLVVGLRLADRLKQELITRAELDVAAHKQGFSSLDDIARAILDPGGGFCFLARKPTADDSRHGEIMARLDELSAQLSALQAPRG